MYGCKFMKLNRSQVKLHPLIPILMQFQLQFKFDFFYSHLSYHQFILTDFI